MKKTVFFVLLVATTGVLTSTSVLSSSAKKEAQPATVDFTKTATGFKRDLGSAD
ncbi:hypothetical protein [Mucilaginibacter celer]|uniref:hypothetical protein n=1 Tax=Mucilaginibacter celer TaxID=2305508 RepID=UPI0013CED22A|nr:hypothetical protein [Mucilaginibacter celer]